MTFFIVLEFECVTECRDYRDDTHCCSVICQSHIVKMVVLLKSTDRIQMAIGIVNTQVPDACVTSLGVLDKVQSDIKSMIIRNFYIVWLRIDIDSVRGLM